MPNRGRGRGRPLGLLHRPRGQRVLMEDVEIDGAYKLTEIAREALKAAPAGHAVIYDANGKPVATMDPITRARTRIA